MSKCVKDNFGNRKWYNDKWQFHREDGPAIEYSNGSEVWYLNGLCHRENGPAFTFLDCYQEWWFNGKRHRLDGPAREYFNGSKQWYFKGKQIDCFSQEEFIKLVYMKAFW